MRVEVGKAAYFTRGILVAVMILVTGLLATSVIVNGAYYVGALMYRGQIPLAQVLVFNRLGLIVGPYVAIVTHGVFFFGLRRQDPSWRLRWTYGILAITAIVIHGAYWYFGQQSQFVSLRWALISMVIAIIPIVADRLGSRFPARNRAHAYDEGLTQRETEIVGLLVDGKSARQIGNELFISESTVKNHIQNSYKKLGVKNRVQLLGRVSPRPPSSPTHS